MDAYQKFCNESGGDNRLNNWEKWLYIHKKQSNKLITKINRNSNALLMNRFINEQRYIKQEKKFIDKAEKYIKSDYYRGHPDFWKFPTSLKCPNTTLPQCYIAGEEYDRTRPDPVLPFPEYVCTPDKILFEQGIANAGSTGITNWINSPLINKKLEQIERNVKMKIHRPDFEKLIVSGDQFQKNMILKQLRNFDSTEFVTFDQGSEQTESEKATEQSGPDSFDTFNEIDDSENNCVYVKLILSQPIEFINFQHVKERSLSQQIEKEVESHSSESSEQKINLQVKTYANNNKMNFKIEGTDEQLMKLESSNNKDSVSITKDVEIQVNLSHFSSFGSTEEKVVDETDLRCERNETLLSAKSQPNRESMPREILTKSKESNTDRGSLGSKTDKSLLLLSTEKSSEINVLPETNLDQVGLYCDLTRDCTNNVSSISKSKEKDINKQNRSTSELNDTLSETYDSLKDLKMNIRNQTTQVDITVSGTLISDKDNQSQLTLFNFSIDDKETQRTLSQTISQTDDSKSDKLFGPSISEEDVNPNVTSENFIKINEIGSAKIEEVLQHFEKTILYANCEINRRYERILEFVNENSVSIRYEWLQRPKIKYEIIEPPYVTNFFFNRNSGTILPGGRVQFRVNFKSKYPGVFRETWVFQTIPRTYEKPSLINFEAVALDHSDDSKRKCIEKYLEYRVTNAYARNKVNDMINRVDEQSPKEMPYREKLLEEEIFNHNNPDLFYDSNSVHVLKDINYKTTSHDWDYSVQNLRQNILKTESTDLKAQYLEMFSKHVYNLMRPAQKSVLRNKKYKTVYEILCSFFDQMENESVYLKKCLRIPGPSKASYDSLLDLKYTELEGKNKRNKLKRNSTKNSKISAVAMPSIETIERESEHKESDFKKDEYVQCLYIKTYEHLSDAIDEMAATLESISVLEKKSIFSCLGK